MKLTQEQFNDIINSLGQLATKLAESRGYDQMALSSVNKMRNTFLFTFNDYSARLAKNEKIIKQNPFCIEAKQACNEALNEYFNKLHNLYFTNKGFMGYLKPLMRRSHVPQF